VHILADRYLTTPADGNEHDAESEQDDPRDEQNQPSGRRQTRIGR